jgi:hypothetical protein
VQPVSPCGRGTCGWVGSSEGAASPARAASRATRGRYMNVCAPRFHATARVCLD